MGLSKRGLKIKSSKRHDKNKDRELNEEEIFDNNNEGMAVDDTSSQVSSQDHNKPENLFNCSNKTVIIKNLTLSVSEEDLESFIKSQCESFNIEDIRIVRDKKGNSKGFAFVDFPTIEEATNCSKILNNKILLDNMLSCAVSKPPALGENDKRTIFINNLPFDATEDAIRSTFEKVNISLIHLSVWTIT